MRLVFPNSYRINRGNYVVKDLAEACRANNVTDLVVLHEHRGTPGVSCWCLCLAPLTPGAYTLDAMIVSHFPHGPTLYFTLHNVTLRHDIESYRSSTVSEQYPHLIFENFSSRLGERVRDCLKYLFPVPKEDSKRVMTFSNENDFISFRWVTSLVLAEGVNRKFHQGIMSLLKHHPKTSNLQKWGHDLNSNVRLSTSSQ